MENNSVPKQGRKMGFIDRFLTLWIFLAMAVGLAIGNWFPYGVSRISSVSTGTTNIPLAVGLILMMYPPLVKVKFSGLRSVFKDIRILSLSLVLNWLVGPLLMFFLAVIFLKGQPEYMSGLILIGVARCIAMVVVWNDLAGGSRHYAAGLIALNSIFQVFVYGFMAYFFIAVVPVWFGLKGYSIDISIGDTASTVGIYLGIPFFLALFSRSVFIRYFGEKWFSEKFLPFISPLTLIALLFTIVVMFSMKGGLILQIPMDAIRIAIPLLLYFAIMFSVSMLLSKYTGSDYPRAASVAFTAAGNNFELAIAVAIGVFGVNSGQAFTGVIGPLVEVPALIILVHLSKLIEKRFYKPGNNIQEIK